MNGHFNPLSKKTIWIVTFFIIAINLVFKIWNIFSMSMYEDEPFTLYIAQQSLEEIIKIHTHDSNPFVHTIIMHYWFKIFGLHLWAGKLYSVILSSLSAGLLFKLFYKRFGLVMPLIAALLFTLSGVNFFHAQEMRVYPQLILLTILSIYFFTELIFNPNRKNAFLLGVIHLLLLMSHYTAFFLPLAELGILFFYIKSHKKTIKYFVVSQFLAALIFSPWFFYATINNMPQAGKSWIQTPYLIHIPWFINKMATYTMAIINVGLFITISLLTIFRKKNTFSEYRFMLFFTGIFWGTMAASFIVSKKIPIMSDRYLLFSTIGLFLSIGYAISILHIKKSITIAIALFVIIAASFSVHIRPNPENWPTKVKYIKKHKNDNELVFIYPWWSHRAFAYYYDKKAFEDYHLTNRRLNIDNVIPTNDIDFIANKIVRQNSKTLFLVMYKGGKDQEIINRIKSLGYNVSYFDDKLKPTLVQFEKL